MFEEMRDAGLARRIVGGAVAIPNHMRHDRRAAIWDDDDIQAICELCLRNRRPRRFALRLRRRVYSLPHRRGFTKGHSSHRFQRRPIAVEETLRSTGWPLAVTQEGRFVQI